MRISYPVTTFACFAGGDFKTQVLKTFASAAQQTSLRKSSSVFVLILFFTLSFLNRSEVMAQGGPVFTFYKDDSLLRKKYFEQAGQINSNIIGALSKENKDEYKKIYDSRFKEIENILTTSRSVTAPEANNYLQSIVQQIVASNPSLKDKELRIVFTRDAWPNAYSMGEGTIGINAGLLLFLENEAQLAFVLSHELAHYYLDHSGKSIKQYVETVTDAAFQKELKRLSKQQFRVNEQLEKLTKNLAFDGRKHSRNHESESDSLALVFMKNAGYDGRAAITTLALLDKIDDSLLFKPLSMQQAFHFEAYPFKMKWIQKETSIFSQVDEKDNGISGAEKDSLKTHPDCTKRIALLQKAVSAPGNNGNLFVVSERDFKLLKQKFTPEVTEYCYQSKNLSRNLYYSLQLLNSGVEKPLAIYSVARCMNEIYDKQQQHKLGLAVDSENKNFTADYNELLRMLDKLRLEEIASLNVNFCRKYEAEMRQYENFRQEMLKALTLK